MDVQDACAFDAWTVVAVGAAALVGSVTGLRLDGDVGWAVAEGGDGGLSCAGLSFGHADCLWRGFAWDLWCFLAWTQLGLGCCLRCLGVGCWTLELSADAVLAKDVLANDVDRFLWT